VTLTAPTRPPPVTRTRRRQPGESRRTLLAAHGEPMVWLTGGALAIAVAMIVGLLVLVASQGLSTFTPEPVVQYTLHDGRVFMGEVTRRETGEGGLARTLVRTGNFDLGGEHFRWIDDADVATQEQPPWALVVERQAWGRFYGTPVGLETPAGSTSSTPEEVWARFEAEHGDMRARWRERMRLERGEIGAVNRELEQLRLAVRAAALAHGEGSPEQLQAAEAQARRAPELEGRYEELRGRIAAMDAENAGYRLLARTADGQQATLPLADVVRAYPANRLSAGERAAVYASRWWEFLTDEPREANSEGGVLPAIFGTVLMTLVMALLVTPFGVLAALYLREYAKQGVTTSAVRIAVNNLAGVPSIVFGVFGLGFFCYMAGAGLDALFFPERLPSPTFGTGGVMWSSFTLALLTLPVVIVATEEALAAVPSSMREGSYACGASKWQTIRRIVLPRAMPGIMTGLILALARGAGEVAPLMLVGAVKLAPKLPVDGEFPFLHLQRSFMHLGFHIYDLGFQSQNSEAAKPMVFTTTLLLIGIVVVLNLLAVAVRSRLRTRYVTGRF